VLEHLPPFAAYADRSQYDNGALVEEHRPHKGPADGTSVLSPSTTASPAAAPAPHGTGFRLGVYGDTAKRSRERIRPVRP
jgi:hypothetical protein